MAALDSCFTTLSTFSKLLILQVSVQQDTNLLTAGENTGLSLPGQLLMCFNPALGRPLLSTDSIPYIQITWVKPPAFPTADTNSCLFCR